jgi:hypothetical protein
MGLGKPMSGQEWHCFRVRPANHPRRRIAGAARLVARYLDTGLVNGLTALAAADHPQDLAGALTVGSQPGTGPAYIGQDRARDLAVNVVLPLAHTLAVSQNDIGVTQLNTISQAEDHRVPVQNYPQLRKSYDSHRAHWCLDLYHRFGKLQENEVTAEMSEQLMDPSWGKVVVTARRQQGLIHLQQLLAGAAS